MNSLYISDLDGTLLTREERISEYSKNLLNRMLRAGLPLTYATARSMNTAKRATEGLENTLPAIFYNGALIASPVTGEILRFEKFEREDREWLIEKLRRLHAPPMVYAMQDGRETLSYLVGHETEGMRRYLARREGDPRLNPVTTEDALLAGDIFYVNCIKDKASLDPVWREVSDGRFSVLYARETYQSDYWLEIMPAAATKARAALRLKEMFGFDRIVCFGDGENDLDLFEVADERYAVKNADEALKRLATEIIGYCEEDGVAKRLASMVGITE